MNHITIDISQMDETDEIHRYLKHQFEFPDYYGANLDALYDMLTDICRDTVIVMVFTEDAKAPGYCYNRRIRQVFLAAARENRYIKLIDRMY